MSTDADALLAAPQHVRIASVDTLPLLAELLQEQQRLQTPVARFAEAHVTAPSLEPVYRDLIPLTAPASGEQYAFEVDLDRCTGCKACVAGCHSMNGLDEEETWRDVGLVLGSAPAPYQQTVTTACHHCADPGCLNGCPVLAYEKDPVTGIVRHLDDQCIGCQYCILKCPYDVPKYNARLGIVRKCDMCQNRLAIGEAPACVQACPTQAIRIVAVSSHVSSPAAAEHFLPSAPSPDYTRPTTRYVSKRPIPPTLHPGDAGADRIQQAHWPLVLMLTATQAGFGTLAGAILVRAAGREVAFWELAGLGVFFAGIVASVAHLGQPLRAWRVFLNLRKSWLSREAVVFGMALPVAAAYVSACRLPDVPRAFLPALGGAALLTGFLGVFCSAMIYADTRRHLWRATVSIPRFLGTSAVFTLAVLHPPTATVTLLLKVVLELLAVRPDHGDRYAAASYTARLLRGPLKDVGIIRAGLAAAAAGLLLVGQIQWAMLPLLAGEIAERYLYFRAVHAPKMPGVPQL